MIGNENLIQIEKKNLGNRQEVPGVGQFHVKWGCLEKALLGVLNKDLEKVNG